LRESLIGGREFEPKVASGRVEKESEKT